MRFGFWNIRTLYKELSKYKLDLVGVKEVGWEGGNAEPAEEYIFLRKGD
jgi:hypothetical protein